MRIVPRFDPMGHAVREYFEHGRANKLRVLSSMFDEDEMPVPCLFRTLAEMPELEVRALSLARGRVLDVGAAAGCHSLVLSQRGIRVKSIDISEMCVDVMRRRGVPDAEVADFFVDDYGKDYDTVLMLMNGIGMGGTVSRFGELFARFDAVLAPGGQVLADSSDLRYVFEDEDGTFDPESFGHYYGEIDYRMVYDRIEGRPFDWLYVDFDTLGAAADRYGYHAECVMRDTHFHYLARLTRKSVVGVR